LVRALALLLLLTGPAGAQCRLALVLGFDVSASVDAREYALMMQGTAAALVSPAVTAAALADGPVAVAAFVWAGRREQAVVARWTRIDTPGDLARLAARIAAFPRPEGDPLGPWTGRTAVGAALVSARSLLDSAPVCDAQTVDLAGDGDSNDGPAPAPLRARLFHGVTINALAVGGDLPLDHGTMAEEGGRLSAWFTQNVLWGPGAFVESAADYDDFERAISRKLVRELQPPLLGLRQIPGAGADG
jgi:hypothetical protein